MPKDLSEIGRAINAMYPPENVNLVQIDNRPGSILTFGGVSHARCGYCGTKTSKLIYGTDSGKTERCQSCGAPV